MAKLPKIGGVKPDDPVYKELLQGLQKREQAMKSAAAAQEKAAKEQQVAAERIETAAQNLSDAAEDLTRATEGNNTANLGEQLSKQMGSIGESIGSIVNFVASPQTRTEETVENRRSARQNVFTEILETNKQILDATLGNQNILLKLLDFFQKQRTEKITADYKDQRIEGSQGVQARRQRGQSNDFSSLGTITKLLTIAAGALVGYIRGQIKAITAIAKTISNIVEALGSVSKKLLGFFKNKFDGFFQSIDDILTLSGEAIKRRLSNITRTAGSFIDKITDIFKGDSAIAKIVRSVTTFIKNLKNDLLAPFEYIGSMISKVGETIRNVGSYISKIGTTVTESISSVTKMFQPIIDIFNDAGKEIKGLFGFVEEFFKPVRSISRYFSQIGKLFTRVAGLASKLFAPIGVIVAAFETISGAIKGYEEGGILGALEGAVVGLFEGTLGGLADMIKDATSWLLEQLGFENLSKMLDSFSFTELFKDLVHAILHPIETITKLFDNLPNILLDAIPSEWLREQVRDLFGMGQPGGAPGAQNPPPEGSSSTTTPQPASPSALGAGQQMVVRPAAGSNVTPVPNESPTAMANQSAQQAAGSATPPVVVNNNTVNNNNVNNGGSGSDNRIGGNIITSPPQSHIDRSMYGYDQLHSATP